jgi:hypothetical protein
MEAHDTGGRLAAIVGLLEAHGFRVVTEQDPLFERVGLNNWNVYAVRPR